ncbi:hypothetical protein E4U46_005919 [Claviceps purpurea]|nr:hypothetical protein E4U46_005919 [Claviceps purpurea]
MAPANRASTRASSSRRSASRQPATDHQFPSPESTETSLRPPSSTSDVLLQALANQINSLSRSTDNQFAVLNQSSSNQFAVLTESVQRVSKDNAELWQSIRALQNRPQASSGNTGHFPKPVRFSGEDLSIFRGWWTSVTAYLDANADSLATDKIKIDWVGSFLTGKAQVWHLARLDEYSPPNQPDTWKSYSEELTERFTDISLDDKNHKKMETLVYKGDIHDFLTQFQELNTSGHGLGFFERRLIYQAIPQRIIDLLFARHMEEPKSDHDFIKALKQAGKAYNRIPSVGTDSSTTTVRSIQSAIVSLCPEGFALGCHDEWHAFESPAMIGLGGILASIRGHGVPCIIAAANDGDSGLFYINGGASGKGVMAMASLDNIEVPLISYHSSYTIDGGRKIDFLYTPGADVQWGVSMPLYSTSLDYHVGDDACQPLPANTPGLKNYLVLVRRGTCSYDDKLRNLVAKGAQ